MKVYLDDERATPEGWVRAFTVVEAILLLSQNKVDEISLDHDLGDDENIGTGNDVLLWIEERVFTDEGYIPPRIFVHSANASVYAKMVGGIGSIERRVASR